MAPARSEEILGGWSGGTRARDCIVATKIPPKNFKWPSRRGFTLDECFPPDHIREYTEKSLDNLGLSAIDLQQFHVWEDAWAHDDRWHRAVDDLKRQGLIRAVGVSVNRWEPANVIETIRTGLIDSVQVIYNIFDQAPEDELFPLCRERKIAVIARVPFDEGTLTGTLTRETRWPEGDWRNSYFVPENLIRQRRPRRGAPPPAPRQHDHARAGLAVDPRGADRRHDHPRDAQGEARRGQPRRQRWQTARSGARSEAQGPSLGSPADGMVAVRKPSAAPSL